MGSTAFCSYAKLCLGSSWQSMSFTLVVAVVVAAAILDIAVYRVRKGKLPGPLWPFPLVGGVIEMIVAPVAFWQRQIDYCRNGLSVNSLAGRFMVFITNSKTCYKVYTNTGDFILFAHPNAKYLFGEENLIYMEADVHKKMRTLLIPGIYTKEALGTYLGLQERVIRKHLDAIAAAGSEVEARMVFRLMNADASQEAFVGPYLTAEEKSWLADEILCFTVGFLSVPIPFPRGGLWRAIRARNGIRKLLTAKMALAEQYIREGHQPRCVVDFWLREIVTKGTTAAAGVTHEDLATTILDFMFASQDATTSAVAWALDLLTRRPDVAQRIRDEVATAAAAVLAPGVKTEQLLQFNGMPTAAVGRIEEYTTGGSNSANVSNSASRRSSARAGSNAEGSSSAHCSSNANGSSGADGSGCANGSSSASGTNGTNGANGTYGSNRANNNSGSKGSSGGDNGSSSANGNSSAKGNSSADGSGNANGCSVNGAAANKDGNGAVSDGEETRCNGLIRDGSSNSSSVDYISGQVNGHSTTSRRLLLEYFKDLKYTQNCALELLRYRPPVPMVPHLAKRRVELAPGVMVPKGTMVIPSVVAAAQNEDGANVFDADNLLDPNFNKVFVFGAGQHKCPGRLYASQLLAVFLAVLVDGYSWERRLTEKTSNIIYAPTLYQEDNLYTFRKH